MTEPGTTPAPGAARRHAEYEQELIRIRRRYLDSLPEKISALEKALKGFAQADRPAPELAELNRMAHQLAASAGSHGLKEVSDAARRLDDACEGLNSSDVDAAREVRNLSDALIKLLRGVAHSGSQPSAAEP